jgi:pimeloyl-ACP methyl ester carboxylesterase
VVLQHGAMGHGEISWGPALPYLTDHYTRHLPSLRNRGRSGHSDDSTPPRLVEDLTAYVDSLGQPVALVGLSRGGALALEAANRAEQVTAVVAYEPPITAIIDEATLSRFTEAVRDEAQRSKRVAWPTACAGSADSSATTRSSPRSKRPGLSRSWAPTRLPDDDWTELAACPVRADN